MRCFLWLVSREVSPSSRRAWIEIFLRTRQAAGKVVALLAEGVDRNIPARLLWEHFEKSPSSRRAWIEIFLIWSCMYLHPVALLAEGVDRNILGLAAVRVDHVALLAEGVDRNLIGLDVVLDPANVALLAEGVDRNCMVASMP